jgi:hypothetical protein
MQNSFESELADVADELEGSGEAWDESADAGDEEAFAEGDPAEALDDDAADDEGFDDDGFEDESFDEGEELEASAFDDDGLDELDGADEGFDGADMMGDDLDDDDLDEGDALDDAFATAMDAASEDEFVRRFTISVKRLRQIGRPYFQRMVRRVLPIMRQLVARVSRLSRARPTTLRADSMDVFADFAADEAFDDADEFVGVLAGLAGRYIVRSLMSSGARRAKPAVARALGKAATKAIRKVTKAAVRKSGPSAMRMVTRVVRKVAQAARRSGTKRQVPRMIVKTAKRVLRSRPAVARLSRPNRVVRQMRKRAVPRRGAAGVSASAFGPLADSRVIEISGPVRILPSSRTQVRMRGTQAAGRRTL